MTRRLVAFVKRTVRAARHVATNPEIPRPIRWLAAVACLPVPGPFDELVLLVVAAVLAAFYRPQLRSAWRESL